MRSRNLLGNAVGLLVAAVLYFELHLQIVGPFAHWREHEVPSTSAHQREGLNNRNLNDWALSSDEEESKQRAVANMKHAATAAVSGSGTDEGRCRIALDSLDELFDRKRRIRQELVKSLIAKTDVWPKEETAFFDLYEPEAVCLLDERFGGSGEKRYAHFGDGPKFVCGADVVASQEGTCLVYSVGSKNEIDFERSAKEIMGCEVHTFDPTLRKPFIGDKYAVFHPWGFGREGGSMEVRDSNITTRYYNITTRSLAGVMKSLRHDGKILDILKIDCEGCEYEAVTDAFKEIAAGNLTIGQVQVEIHKYYRDGHDLHDLANLFRAADVASMRIFHKERNGWGCNGYKCVEYSFVSESVLRRVNAMAMGCSDHINN
uniref:Methyltransferase domain-containing protein n=1 Tax=Odontella aurita TaxID=265563 RepID=A0A7S4JD16_9STRA|mmetsp:Transcript_44073/g.134175  ORF Transcript_44073/g.134175 Transcript_44073/m.134175 type:complete len:374 (+) Transcript_44073:188-1309(+)